MSEHIDQALCDLNTQLANLKARVRVLEARAEADRIIEQAIAQRHRQTALRVVTSTSRVRRSKRRASLYVVGGVR